MALKVRWTEIALSDLAQAFEFISLDSPKAAEKTISQIFEALEQLNKFPESGRAGRKRGTRELVLSSLTFIIVYRLKDSHLEILAVLHTSRKWP